VAGRRLARGDSALLRPGETLHLLQIGSERLHPFELRGQTLVWCDQQTSGSKRAEPPAATPPGKRLATAPGSSSSRHPPEAAAATGVPSSAAGSAAGSERLVIDLTEDEDAQLSAHLDGFLGESTSDQMHVKVEGAARAPSTPVKVETAVKLEAAAADPAAAPAAPAGGAEQERALAAWLAAGHDLLHAERMRLAGVLRRSAPSGHAVTELWENPDSVPGRPLYERFVDAWRRASDRRVRIVFHGTPEVPHAFPSPSRHGPMSDRGELGATPVGRRTAARSVATASILAGGRGRRSVRASTSGASRTCPSATAAVARRWWCSRCSSTAAASPPTTTTWYARREPSPRTLLACRARSLPT
jgi:hypothetical protein